MKQNILLWAAVCLSACQNEIPFDIKNNPPKLALHTLIDSNTDKNEIYLSWTGLEHTSLVNDPAVNIYVNDELKEQLIYDRTRIEVANIYPSVNFYTTGVRFSPGDKVKVEAFADNGKHHAWAEDVIPQPVEIEKIDTMTWTKHTWHRNGNYMRLKVKFTDNPNEKNYYRLTVQQNDTLPVISEDAQPDTIFVSKNYLTLITREDFVLTDGKPSFDENNEPFFQTENRCCIFDDTRLNGTYTITVSWQKYDTNPKARSSITVGLSAITEIQYYYLKALNIRGYGADLDLLTQPVSFPDNIQGGVGFLGLSATSVQTLKLPDHIPEKQK
ncbi:MAG: DUF4249 domain-containing protein [Tannerella sp.]|jgi:hypothetical protein|nr:DUF4249 domain-containing protein [Tannerella sp.]